MSLKGSSILSMLRSPMQNDEKQMNSPKIIIIENREDQRIIWC